MFQESYEKLCSLFTAQCYLFIHPSKHKNTIQGFPNGVDWWEDSLGKMTKNLRKITKSTYFRQHSGVHRGEEKPIFWEVGGSPTQSPKSPPHHLRKPCNRFSDVF